MSRTEVFLRSMFDDAFEFTNFDKPITVGKVGHRYYDLDSEGTGASEFIKRQAKISFESLTPEQEKRMMESVPYLYRPFGFGFFRTMGPDLAAYVTIDGKKIFVRSIPIEDAGEAFAYAQRRNIFYEPKMKRVIVNPSPKRSDALQITHITKTARDWINQMIAEARSGDESHAHRIKPTIPGDWTLFSDTPELRRFSLEADEKTRQAERDQSIQLRPYLFDKDAVGYAVVGNGALTHLSVCNQDMKAIFCYQVPLSITAQVIGWGLANNVYDRTTRSSRLQDFVNEDQDKKDGNI